MSTELVNALIKQPETIYIKNGLTEPLQLCSSLDEDRLPLGYVRVDWMVQKVNEIKIKTKAAPLTDEERKNVKAALDDIGLHFTIETDNEMGEFEKTHYENASGETIYQTTITKKQISAHIRSLNVVVNTLNKLIGE